jgi:transposase
VPKYTEDKQRRWVKAHLYCCCKTNAFVAVEITKKSVSDNNPDVVRKLLKRPTKLFYMKEFVADKAYAVRPIYKILQEMHLEPRIPFKRGAIGLPKKVRLWRICYEKFYKNTEEYMKIYHKRSNIETANHMLKQKFGDSLRTRIFEENINEIKMRVLCHNLCVLIQETFERNIDVDFNACAKMLKPVQK